MGFLRDKMRADLELRGYSIRTQREYVREAKRFAGHYMKSPCQMGLDEAERYILHLLRVRKVRPATHKMVVASLRFLYRVTLDRVDVAVRIPWPKVPCPLPVVLSGSEIEAVLGAIRVMKYRAVVMTMYGAGLRVSEACVLECGDIDGRRKVIRVHGKGDRERYVLLPDRLLRMLREYWRVERPTGPELFPGQQGARTVSDDTIRKALRAAAAVGAPGRRVTPHTLRHSFATHLLETGTDIRVIQVLLGHRSIRTTETYTQVSRRHVGHVRSPLDVLGTDEAKVLG